MEFPVKHLDAFPSADFDGSPKGGSDMNVELLAQMHDNGRDMDHWRLSVGGKKLLPALFPMTAMVRLPALTCFLDRKVVFSVHPDDPNLEH